MNSGFQLHRNLAKFQPTIHRIPELSVSFDDAVYLFLHIGTKNVDLHDFLAN